MSDPGLKGTLHPALRPSNVHAMLKMLYNRPAVAQDLLRTVDEPLDEYRDIAQKATVGSVGEISGEGEGFKFIETQFESLAGTINGYGGAFKVTFEEKQWSRLNSVGVKMNELVVAMRNYYEDKVLSAIHDASTGVLTGAGTDWDSLTNGLPFMDLEKAKRAVYAATGEYPDTVVMNETRYLTLISFPAFQNYQTEAARAALFRGDGVRTLTPNGLEVVVMPDSKVAYIPNGEAWVMKKGNCGVNHRAFPFTTFEREDGNKPLTTNHFAFEYQTPSIDKVDARYIYKLTGL